MTGRERLSAVLPTCSPRRERSSNESRGGACETTTSARTGPNCRRPALSAAAICSSVNSYIVPLQGGMADTP